jgi:outer membrane scaffolding protein for murein synthesis (MipA/OmpV family)
VLASGATLGIDARINPFLELRNMPAFLRFSMLAALSTFALNAMAASLTGDIGAGASYGVHDPSGSRYETRPQPYFDVTWDSLELSSDDGLQWSALNQAGWTAGPSVNYLDGRVANGSLRGMGDVDDMLVTGAFVQYSPQPWWNVNAQAGRSTGGGSGNGGWLGKLGGELDYPVYRGIMGSTAVSAHFSDHAMMQTFFGVDGQQAQATGLQRYHAGGGLQATVLSQALQLPLVGHWSLVTNLSWTHLQGAAANSPLVQARGRVDQGEADLAASYHF